MDAHRFFVTWLLVLGLVGAYAQNHDDYMSEEVANWIVARSKYPQLDLSSEEDAISEFENEVRLHKRSPSGMSKEDFDWHIKEGADALKKLSQQSGQQKANREWVKKEMQTKQKNVEIAAAVKAANEKKKDQKVILEQRVPQWKQNRPAPSRRT